MASQATSTCPGCGLETSPGAQADPGSFNASPECMAVFAGVQGAQIERLAHLGSSHQLTVDAYAAQHAGGAHSDKSVAVHLVGLYLALERATPVQRIAPLQHRLADRVRAWPHLDPPARAGGLTIAAAAMSSPDEHAEVVVRWARGVWDAWGAHHDAIARLAGDALGR